MNPCEVECVLGIERKRAPPVGSKCRVAYMRGICVGALEVTARAPPDAESDLAVTSRAGGRSVSTVDIAMRGAPVNGLPAVASYFDLKK